MSTNFQQTLAMGQIGESAISLWLRSRGNWVLPVYEKEIDEYKGPRLFLPQGELIAPDLLVINHATCYWVEAKHKTAFSWYRVGQCWVTGIDIVHYTDYLRVNDESPYPVWLLFFHRGGQAKDSPDQSPSGLFGGSISRLRHCENHRSDRFGKGGMVYWKHRSLTLLATLQELRRTA